MTKFLKYIFALVLCISLIIQVFPSVKSSAYVYGDGFTKVGDITIPFAEYMPGSFFTKNGKPCTCHDVSSINCVESASSCNCLRYVTVNGKDVDLLAVQCIGFARYTFYKLFGFIDADHNGSLFYNAGTISYGNVTAAAVKTLVQKLKPGAHIRYQLAYSQHSVILLNQNSEGFTVYQANAGGNGIESRPCVVSTRTYTWDEFAQTARRGIVFAHMPNNYPATLDYNDTPYGDTMPNGTYRTTSNLNLRSAANTSAQSLAVIPEGTFVTVTAVENSWAKTVYNGLEGWVSIAYLELLNVLTPSANSGISYIDGYIFGIQSGTTPLSLKDAFLNHQVTFSCGGGEYIGTGVYIDSVIDGYSLARGEVVIYGDINGDGFISATDCLTLKEALSSTKPLQGAFFIAADVNNTGSVNTTDYLKLKYYLTNGIDKIQIENPIIPAIDE